MENSVKPNKDNWDKAEILGKIAGPLVVGLVIGFFGYWLKDSVELAFKQQEIELSSAAAIQGLVADLLRPNATQVQADAAALAMASFGRPALIPLTSALMHGSSTIIDASKKSMFALSLTYSQETCITLKEILNNRNKQFSHYAHLAVVQLLGEVGCGDALESLESYFEYVKDDSPDARKNYQSILSDKSAPSVAAIDEIKDQTILAIKRVTES